MGWLVFLVVVIIVSQLFGGRKNQQEFNKPADTKETDDFAGGSIGSYFLMEEFIDPDDDDREPEMQGYSRDDHEDDDFWQEEFFD